jgi:hypothetical protein
MIKKEKGKAKAKERARTGTKKIATIFTFEEEQHTAQTGNATGGGEWCTPYKLPATTIEAEQRWVRR